MIRVRRVGPIPAALDGPQSAGARELERNRKFAREQRFGDMAFNAYRDQSVKDALGRLFHRKCAYCESTMLGVMPGDVEHYRPKREVAVRDPAGRIGCKRGYYWLAAEWSNLLPSCIDCNRKRMQELLDGKRRVVGKGSWFPLSLEQHRARWPSQVAREAALLLDPCNDDPEKHIAFTEDGEIFAKRIRNRPSARGVATIEVCGLARIELMQRRAAHKKSVMAAIRHTKQALDAGEDPGQDLEDLVDLLGADREYLAFTRYLVRLHMQPYLAALGL